MNRRLRDKHYAAKVQIQNQELKARKIQVTGRYTILTGLHHYRVQTFASPAFEDDQEAEQFAAKKLAFMLREVLARNVVKDESFPEYSLDIWVQD